jgi:hypothetical protein
LSNDERNRPATNPKLAAVPSADTKDTNVTLMDATMPLATRRFTSRHRLWCEMNLRGRGLPAFNVAGAGRKGQLRPFGYMNPPSKDERKMADGR